jgi:hypothetical protein
MSRDNDTYSFDYVWLRLCSYAFIAPASHGSLGQQEQQQDLGGDHGDQQDTNGQAFSFHSGAITSGVQRSGQPTPETGKRKRRRKNKRKHAVQMYSFQPKSDMSKIQLGGRVRKVNADLQESGIRFTARRENSSSNCWAVALCKGFNALGCNLRMALVESMLSENACRALVELCVLQLFRIQRLQQLQQQAVQSTDQVLRLTDGVYLVRVQIFYCTGEQMFHVLVYTVSARGRHLLDGYADATVCEAADFGTQRSQMAFCKFLRDPNDKIGTAVQRVLIREVFRMH